MKCTFTSFSGFAIVGLFGYVGYFGNCVNDFTFAIYNDFKFAIYNPLLCFSLEPTLWPPSSTFFSRIVGDGGLRVEGGCFGDSSFFLMILFISTFK